MSAVVAVVQRVRATSADLSASDPIEAARLVDYFEIGETRSPHGNPNWLSEGREALRSPVAQPPI